MTSDSASRRFSPEEVNAILQRALERQGGAASGSVSYNDLVETARELGIDAAQLESALAEQESVGAIESARERWKVQRKRKFMEHLRSYLIVNFMLVLLNYFTWDGWWVLWVICGWGMGIAFDFFDAYYPKERDIERGARKMVEREARQRRRDNWNGVSVGKGSGPAKKSVTIDGRAGKIIIEKGDKRIEIG
ncbi:MAG TPA: 2TM domain-containing protein [Candidatus Kapabacteria bacterium]|nr:2TM domain-containing protein [Candidatus Kapabacteria bacterium]